MKIYEFNDEVEIPADQVMLYGNLAIPKGAEAVVIFAHGTGSSRFSTRNQFVAQRLQEEGYATLLFDLLTADEHKEYFNRFQIDLLVKRLVKVTEWIVAEIMTAGMAIGYFGASTGAAAALIAASELTDKVLAVVSRGGRPDLADPVLNKVLAPVLLIVGGNDEQVIELNEAAYQKLETIKELLIIEEATHLFEEPGKLEEVTDAALGWFDKYLKTKVPL